MNQLIKNIRRNYIIDVFRFLFPVIILGGTTIGMVFLMLYNDTRFLLFVIPFGIFTIPAFVMFINKIILAINPFRSKVFRKYGSPEKVASIYREIQQTKEYEDHAIVVSRNYICHKKRYEILVACNDVLAVHKVIHKTNFIVDYYQIIVTDKYGEELQFTYKKNEESIVNNLISRLKSKCQNAEVGYNQDASDHIQRNKISLDDTPPSMPFKATFKSNEEKSIQQIEALKQASAKQKRKNAWKTFWKCLGIFTLGFLCSDILLAFLLDDSIKGLQALSIIFLTAIPFWGLFYYLFIGLKKKKATKTTPTTSNPIDIAPMSTKSISAKSEPNVPVKTGKIENYGIISSSLASGFVDTARKIIKEQISIAITEHELTRKTDLMKIIFGYISHEFKNAKGERTDLVVSAYYQIAFDEIVSQCGDMNDLLFNYSTSKVSGIVGKDIHKYLQLIVKIQIIIDDSIASCQSSNATRGQAQQLHLKVLNELNSYIDDSTEWNKL